MQQTNNPSSGFCGTIDANQQQAWNIAVSAIMAETGHDEGAVRDFLDSDYGRQFASLVNDIVKVVGIERAIETSIEVCRARKLSNIGNWKGLPEHCGYLDGLIRVVGRDIMRYANWQETEHVDEFLRMRNAHPRVFEVGFYDRNENWRVLWDQMRPDERRSIDFFLQYNATRCSDVFIHYSRPGQIYGELSLARFLSCGLPD